MNALGSGVTLWADVTSRRFEASCARFCNVRQQSTTTTVTVATVILLIIIIIIPPYLLLIKLHDGWMVHIIQYYSFLKSILTYGLFGEKISKF